MFIRLNLYKIKEIIKKNLKKKHWFLFTTPDPDDSKSMAAVPLSNYRNLSVLSIRDF